MLYVEGVLVKYYTDIVTSFGSQEFCRLSGVGTTRKPENRHLISNGFLT